MIVLFVFVNAFVICTLFVLHSTQSTIYCITFLNFFAPLQHFEMPLWLHWHSEAGHVTWGKPSAHDDYGSWFFVVLHLLWSLVHFVTFFRTTKYKLHKIARKWFALSSHLTHHTSHITPLTSHLTPHTSHPHPTVFSHGGFSRHHLFTTDRVISILWHIHSATAPHASRSKHPTPCCWCVPVQ